MIKPLPNPVFLPAFLKVIDGARKSLVVINYLAQIDGSNPRCPVLAIAKALVRAKKRGVCVSVFLEGSKFENNYAFYRHLKDNGADAWLDTSKTFIHEKALVADDCLIIIGSHNLTRASFELSEELSVFTDDGKVIESFRSGLVRISSQRTALKEKKAAECVTMPAAFVRNAVAPLYKAHAGLAFDLYMFLVIEDGGSCRPLPIDAERWGRALGFSAAGRGITKKYKKYYFTQRINGLFYQLKRPGLIEIDRVADTVSRAARPLEGEECAEGVKIPGTFWTNGWLEKLSFAAKYFYFISLLETTDSPFYPWWSLSMRALTKKYGCDHGIGKGARELARLGAIEILESPPVKRGNSYSEEAQYYRVNPL